MSDDNLTWLETWYQKQCNGEWEHSYGIHIDTLDNPAWTVKINLNGTRYAGPPNIKIEVEYESDHDWMVCKVVESVYEGAGGRLCSVRSSELSEAGSRSSRMTSDELYLCIAVGDAPTLRSLLMRLHILPKRSIDPALVPRTRLAEKLQHIRIQPDRNLLLVLHGHKRRRPRPHSTSRRRRNVAIVNVAVLQLPQSLHLLRGHLRRILRIQSKLHDSSTLHAHNDSPSSQRSVESPLRATCKPNRSQALLRALSLPTALHPAMNPNLDAPSDSRPQRCPQQIQKKRHVSANCSQPWPCPSQTPRNQYSTTSVVTRALVANA
jgi:hypothetical protein